MAKAFTTTTLIRGKEPILRRLVCQVRYRDGHLYLDHSGRLLKSLCGEAPEWVIAPNPMAEGTILYNIINSMQLGFSMNSASLILDKTATDEMIDEDEKEQFLDQLHVTVGRVLDELEVADYARIGFRENHYFSFDTKAEAEQWLRELGLITVIPELFDAFSATPEEYNFAVTMSGPECRYRVGLQCTERAAQVPAGAAVLSLRASTLPKGQKKALLDRLKKQRQRQMNTAFAAVLDIDSFLLDPSDIDLRGFVKDRLQSNLSLFREALTKIAPKKGI